MLITEAFAQYKAKLTNRNWSVSSFNEDGELVLSLWQDMFSQSTFNGKKSIKYSDKTSRWSGHGQKEFVRNLNDAVARDLPVVVRAVIANTSDIEEVKRGGDASKLKNTFNTKPDWKGTITIWDGDTFEIEFISQ